MQYAPSMYPDNLADVVSALNVKLGPDEYHPLVSDQHPSPKTRSAREHLPQRLPPKYLSIIATPKDYQRERLKAERKGDWRSECVGQYFPM